MEFVSLLVFGVMIVVWMVLPDPSEEPASQPSEKSPSPSLATPVYET